VADSEDEDDQRAVTDRVDDSIGPDSDAVQIILAFEFFDAVRARVPRERIDPWGDSLPNFGG
jgi:hypothetical protein